MSLTQNIVCDLRSHFTPVRDQGKRPLCLAFAASDLNSFINQIKLNLSVEYLAHHAYDIERNTNYASGLMVSSVIEALSKLGQPSEDEHPYDHAAIAPKVPNSDFEELFYAKTCESVDFVSTLEEQLNKDSASVICITLPQSFFNIREPFELNNEVGYVGGHAVVVVGMAIKPDGTKYFLIRNSWSSAWADNGHCWLSQEFIAQRAFALITVNN